MSESFYVSAECFTDIIVGREERIEYVVSCSLSPYSSPCQSCFENVRGYLDSTRSADPLYAAPIGHVSPVDLLHRTPTSMFRIANSGAR